ncbi:MAG: response regulator [Verrucomicrobia bacterium]|nr:response regulator [Verrucomicrobiota bacterium]
MKIRALIVDDEPLARQRIRLLLAEEKDVEILAECGNGPEALAVIQRAQPDLLFLDVQMPEMDGFGLLAAIPPGQMPVVIFVTAYDQHALHAFEVSALDYLLKPFTPTRFQATVQRARERLAAPAKDDTAVAAVLELLGRQSGTSPYLTRLSIKTTDKIVFLKTEQIDCIESAGNYVAVQSGKDTHILRDTLNALESRLNPAHFLRISRSTIVNLNHIKELQPHFKGEHVVLLQNGKRLTMTRGLREVEQAMKFN